MGININLKQLLFKKHGIPQNPGLHNFGINKRINNVGEYITEKYERAMNDKIHSALGVDGGTTPAVSTYPTAGNGFDFNISNNTCVDGLIPAGSYEFAQTFIYDNNQESLPTEYSTVVVVDNADD